MRVAQMYTCSIESMLGDRRQMHVESLKLQAQARTASIGAPSRFGKCTGALAVSVVPGAMLTCGAHSHAKCKLEHTWPAIADPMSSPMLPREPAQFPTRTRVGPGPRPRRIRCRPAGRRLRKQAFRKESLGQSGIPSPVCPESRCCHML